MNIIDCIPFGQENAITYNELRRLTGYDKRTVRREISRARKEYVILNLQDGNGFFRPTEKERQLAKRFYYQEKHRLSEFTDTLFPLMKFLFENH